MNLEHFSPFKKGAKGGEGKTEGVAEICSEEKILEGIFGACTKVAKDDKNEIVVDGNSRTRASWNKKVEQKLVA